MGRGIFVLAGALGFATLSATTSCSAPDPGAITFVDRSAIENGEQGSNGGGGDGGGGGASSGGASSGGGSSGATIDAFTGAGAFVTGTAAGTSQNGDHPNGGNPAGQDCMQCHSAAGPGPNWGIAGTVYQTQAGGQIVAGAQIRVVDATGKELAKVYSDTLGNYWSAVIPGGIPNGSKAGVRNATATKLMVQALTTADGSCQKSTCHVPGGAAQGRVFLQ